MISPRWTVLCPLASGLHTRETSSQGEARESNKAITQERRENTDEEYADRPLAHLSVRGLECVHWVASEACASVTLVTALRLEPISRCRMDAGVELLSFRCSRSIHAIQRVNESSKNPDEA